MSTVEQPSYDFMPAFMMPGGILGRRNAFTVRSLRQRIPVTVTSQIETATLLAADIIAGAIHEAAAVGRRMVLGLPTGRTPLGVYRRLVAWHRAGVLDFSHVTSFNLDEYYPMSCGDRNSYWTFMRRHLFDHVNMGNIHIPRGDLPEVDIPGHVASYEEAIRRVGGIDVMLLGIGGNGHIGFNEPGSSATSTTRMVTLSPETRAAAATDFGDAALVPSRAITMGVATIRASRRIVLLALGDGKASAVTAAAAGPVSETCPASLLQGHPRVEIIGDCAAVAQVVCNR